MRFVDFIVDKIVGGFQAVIDFLFSIFGFMKPVFSFLLDLLMGIGYFLMQLALVVWAIIKLFVALFQFLGAIVVGFFRTLFSFINPTFNTDNVNLPNETGTGMTVVFDLFTAGGFNTVVPMVILAIFWFFFAMAVIKLIGKGN